MATVSSSSSSSVNVDGFTYDVFLSFRGEDTRYEFTGSLWKALMEKGIRTFFDEKEIRKGDEITPSLLHSIQQSRMALVVLSPNYASSSFCLEELSNILNCIRGNNRLVWPIFYDVDPSHMRKLEGTFKVAMDAHKSSLKYNTATLQKWKDALQQVAKFSGTHFKKGYILIFYFSLFFFFILFNFYNFDL